MSLAFDSRVGAYALIVHDQQVLLTHWNPRRADFDGAWTLPGGGMEPGEQPETTMLREVLEETGYTVNTDTLLGVHSRWMSPGQRLYGNPREYHACRVLYTAHVLDGELTVEEDGSSDDTRWVPLVELDELDRLDLVDQALRLAGLGTWVDQPEEQPSPVVEQDIEE
ncbi:NUDIX domain-containing protein [Kocuria carniphila]|uniref:NUDIX hydrolase n=1 Tax=Kocuria carniphila TaxID=262208 RepID=UPI0028E55AF9|nr:NUDIX domain-containing protein [Kocuria carniphila]